MFALNLRGHPRDQWTGGLGVSVRARARAVGKITGKVAAEGNWWSANP